MIVHVGGRRGAPWEIVVLGYAIPAAWDWRALLGELAGTLDGQFRGFANEVPYSMFAELDVAPVDVAVVAPAIEVDRTSLAAYLQSATIEGVPALQRWGTGSNAMVPALVVVVVGAAASVSISPADGYSRAASDLPAIVASQVGAANDPLHGLGYWYGDTWKNAVKRAIGSAFFGLLDEFELPGADYTRPPAGTEGAFNNVIFLTVAQRQMLQAATPPPVSQLFGRDLQHWPVSSDQRLHLIPHQGPPTEVSTAGVRASPFFVAPCVDLLLHEGAAGFRTYAARGSADCLMHRKPGSTELPVNDPGVTFCQVCLTLAQTRVDLGTGSGSEHQVHLHTQTLEFDREPWPGRPARMVGAAARGWSASVHAAGQAPHWGLNARVAPSASGGVDAGLLLEDVTLVDRANDPFVNSPDVFKRISFGNLKVRFQGDAAGRPLDVAAALAETGELAPRLTTQRDDGAFYAQLGFKLELHWEIAGWLIDATQSVCFMRMTNNVDPGSAVMGCKIYPQIALRASRKPGVAASVPRVESLDGTVKLVMNNVVRPADEAAMTIAMGHDPAHADHGMIDALDASLFADGNDAHADNRSYVVPMSIAPPNWPLWSMQYATATLAWASGRRIAAVQTFSSAPTAVAYAGVNTLAWSFHALHMAPILPYWSWLFDYAEAQCAPTAGTSESFVGVWAVDETTAAGQPASTRRRVSLAYPPGNQFVDLLGRTPVPQPQLGVRRAPRQGAFDNIHVTPPMGHDAEGRVIISAPVCADKCFHLHWRWGADGLKAPPLMIAAPERYRGWSHEGRIMSAAVIGAPLIPPNQHLDFAVLRHGPTECELQYAVSARRPGHGHWQVILEQGAAFAFNYDGFGSGAFLAVSSATGVTPDGTSPAARRSTFPRIYSRLRWFTTQDDGVIRNDIQQIPQLSGLPAADQQRLRDT